VSRRRDQAPANPAGDLMIAGKSATEDDVVYVIEVWASEADWERARNSDEIAAWAKACAHYARHAGRENRHRPLTT